MIMVVIKQQFVTFIMAIDALIVVVKRYISKILLGYYIQTRLDIGARIIKNINLYVKNVEENLKEV